MRKRLNSAAGRAVGLNRAQGTFGLNLGDEWEQGSAVRSRFGQRNVRKPTFGEERIEELFVTDASKPELPVPGPQTIFGDPWMKG